MKIQKPQNKGEIIIYQNEEGFSEIDVKFSDESVWLTQKQMAMLFGKDVNTISDHVNKVFKDGELEPNSVYRKSRYTGSDGKNYLTGFYNLDMIISVGYRVNSKQGTKFRIWATKILKDYLVKGYSVNQKRLDELSQNIEIIKRTIENENLKSKYSYISV